VNAPITPGPHPIFAGILADMERTHARMCKQPLTRGVCRCQRFAFPHQYEPACAIVHAMENES